MNLDLITPLIITFNEAENIGRTLAKLSWARQIVVLDSGSTDGTLEIVGQFKQARIVFRKFDDFAGQCNFGLSLIETSWVLSLDADYEVSDALVAELRHLEPGESVSGFRAAFIYRVYGRPLRGTLYPPRTVLYRPQRARYRNEGHGHRVAIDGVVADLNAKIFHDDRKPPSRWFAAQQKYAAIEAAHLLAAAPAQLRWSDRVRRMGWPAPLAVSLYTLLIKRCLFDGWRGWLYTLQRALAETLIALELADRRLRGRP